MTKKHVVLIVGLVLIAAIALINGLLFRVKTVTVDFDTETDGCVTVRDRDTMEQVRVPIAELKNWLREKVAF